MTDCDICRKPLEAHGPWLVWHAGRDGADHGAVFVLCRVCAGAAQYALDLGSDAYVPEPGEELDRWAYKTLWNAVWNPGILTVAEARAARRWLDRMGRADADPAADWLPCDSWGTRGEFAHRSAPALLRRFGLGEFEADRLADAYLKRSGDHLTPVTRDAREMERRLRDA